jgi:hypothetical protein
MRSQFRSSFSRVENNTTCLFVTGYAPISTLFWRFSVDWYDPCYTQLATIPTVVKLKLARGVSDEVNWAVTLPLPLKLPLWNVARQRPQFFSPSISPGIVPYGSSGDLDRFLNYFLEI